MTLGSLFDGIGGWLLAARHAGVKPLWASEIEPFPCSVTARHFPGVTQMGDITKIDGAAIPPVDIICAGSPCQDLSIAGKREGLDGARSGLFRRAVDIVRAMRRATGGQYPRFFVWENVPGAFSSNKGADFQAVLEEIGQAEIPMPPNGRWANAGVAELPQCEIAWRVLDAQYWGVPQRRRRIFLVADFAADGRCAGEILFEREGVSGHLEKSEEAGEGTARGTEDCARPAGAYIPKCARTLTARMDGNPCADRGPQIVAVGFDTRASIANNAPVLAEAVPPMTVSNRLGVMAAGFIGKAPPSAGSIGYGEEIAPTLIAGKQQHVAIYGAKSFSEYEKGQVATLRAAGGNQGGGSENLVMCVGNGQINQSHLQEKAGALNCMHDQQIVLTETTVRRLTPTECERLQGLPDDYTAGGSDTARYKALGNGMAQPCADYVIRRIVEVTVDAQGDRAIR